jgi:NADPH-dependent 2,4-dienoyl-CoA reductase/sulfur reductase-like enzyme
MSAAFPSRRAALAAAGAAALAALAPRARASTTGRVVVVGGGWGGATAARTLARLGHTVTLVERDAAYVSCPFSNTVLGGFAAMPAITFGHDRLAAEGVTVVRAEAADVDPVARSLTLADGRRLDWDRLVLSPGVEVRLDALPGYDATAAETMPHAWKAGAQTDLLRRRIEAMEDGGLFVMAVPANPYRCPPGPYERACLVAHYLKAAKPRSKVLILDAKDPFSKQRLFEEAWETLYPGMIERVPLSGGGKVVEVDAATQTLVTDFGAHEAAVANVIPPQRAGAIARAAGTVDATGWAPVAPESFESRLVPGVHVIGDACFVGQMPKSAFSANAQAKQCAHAIDAALRGTPPPAAKLVNTCYSLAAPDWGFTVAGVYEPVDGRLAEVKGSGGVSPLGASPQTRALEAHYARAWFAAIAAEAFG